jgi:hypothetical protein
MDPISLAFGVIFVTIGVIFLAGFDASSLSGPGAWTAFLAVLGVLLVAIGARRQNR